MTLARVKAIALEEEAIEQERELRAASTQGSIGGWDKEPKD